MKVFHGLEQTVRLPRGSVLTVGNFDGVHRAHQQLIAQSALIAEELGGWATVLTFEPHPLKIISPDRAPPRLCTLDDKLTYLRDAGAETTIVANSDAALLGLTAEQFAEDVISRRLGPAWVVEGPSFRFGRNRQGDNEKLKVLGAGLGFECFMVEPVNVRLVDGDTVPISSSLIRSFICQGLVRRAGLCLGRAYSIRGRVVPGDGRGRTLGFPTANLEPLEQLLPAEGVYAGRARMEQQNHPAAINVGPPLTFGDTTPRIEAHLLAFSGDLLGSALELSFDRFIRPGRRFESAEALVRQMTRDVETVRRGGRVEHGIEP